jgi:hypothetical protein
MSRLLFAAARGARIEALRQLDWIPLTHISLLPNSHAKRIHPDDAHLQYGPISTALREMAKQPKTIHHKGVNLPHFGFSIFAESEHEMLEVLRCDKLTHSLFLLTLAEALADEGM